MKGQRKTIDGRNCMGGCTDNARPGEKGAPAAPDGTQLGQPEVDDDDPKGPV